MTRMVGSHCGRKGRNGKQRRRLEGAGWEPAPLPVLNLGLCMNKRGGYDPHNGESSNIRIRDVELVDIPVDRGQRSGYVAYVPWIACSPPVVVVCFRSVACIFHTRHSQGFRR